MGMKEEDEDEGTPSMIQIIIVFATIGIGIFNVTFDWLWAVDMLNAESSLVFGRPSDGVIGVLITICTVGTVSMVFESVNIIMKTWCDKLIMAENKAQVLSLLVEEVPSMTLSMMLASCREMPISVFQMIGAGFGMIMAMFRMFRVLWKWLCARRNGMKSGFFPKMWRTIILCASIYCALAAMLVFIFTYTPPPSHDQTGVTPPDHLIGRDYDGARYFYKAGIFFSHPNFNGCQNNTDPWMDRRYNWAQFLDLMTMMEFPDAALEVTFLWRDDEELLHTRFSIAQHCHRITHPTCDITIEPTTVCSNADENLYDGKMEFKFLQYERTWTLVFGDIRFQATMDYNGTCHYVTTDEWGMLWADGLAQPDPVAQLHYMKTVKNIEYDVGNFNDVDGELSHFRYEEVAADGELHNVTEVWLTGFRECDMTGSHMPNNAVGRDDLVCA